MLKTNSNHQFPMKTREQIKNKYVFLDHRLTTLANTASHFKDGKTDPALATELLLITMRQRELLWCMSEKTLNDA